MSSGHDAKTNGIQTEVPEPTPSAVSSLKWVRAVIDLGIMADIFFGFSDHSIPALCKPGAKIHLQKSPYHKNPQWLFIPPWIYLLGWRFSVPHPSEGSHSLNFTWLYLPELSVLDSGHKSTHWAMCFHTSSTEQWHCLLLFHPTLWQQVCTIVQMQAQTHLSTSSW